MQPKPFPKAALLALLLVVGFLTTWECYWRSRGFPISYDDDASLWSTKRKQVYAPIDTATVFIGSSRIKFDLDIPTWEKATGERVIQLSFVGTSPRPLLDDLASDERFRGKVIIDVTEGLFFDRNQRRSEKTAVEGIEYYRNWTPAQKASAWLNYALESAFVFLSKEKFSLNSFLDEIPLPKRKGVFVFPLFPREFEMNTADRQNFMPEMFLNDPSLLKKQTDNWVALGAQDKTPGISGEALDAVFKQVKTAIDKIRDRGGQVCFVRTPSSGGYIETEKAVYPREKYWDRMLAYTHAPGLHFEDYPDTARFICPEWSHLSSQDTVPYTLHLIKTLEDEIGWKFQRQSIARR